MDNMEFNKIFAAILVAGIIASLSGFLSKELIHPHKLKENAYPIEGVEDVAGGSGPKKPQGPEPILALLSGADVAKGQKLSRACAACHSFDKGGVNGLGPNMWDIVGRDKASVAGFAYSDALAGMGGQWTYADMNKMLWKPKKYIPGTKMNYIGLKKPEDRAAMIAWLRTLADNPRPLPSASEIAAEAGPDAGAGLNE